MSAKNPMPLRAPDVGRMEGIEEHIRQAQPELAKLMSRLDAAQARWSSVMQRYEGVTDLDLVTERQLRTEFDRASQEHQAAYAAWSATEAPISELRAEWLQLQVVRAFMPTCGICERTAGALHFEFRAADPAQALCLDCFDWACDHDRESGRRPPSHWIELVAGEAREHENARRHQQQGVPASSRHCWHCGESADDLRGWEPEYRSADVMLKAASLVPAGSQPEIGAVCLLCADRDLELLDRWSTIERTLCDPVRRRHERALHRFVMGPAPPATPIVPACHSTRGAGR